MGLMVMLGGWPKELAEHFKDTDDFEDAWKLCRLVGHREYTCPNCGDKACSRCLVGMNP